MTTRVNKVATTIPKINEIAMPWKIGSNKMTLEPKTNAAAVMMIGRVLALHAKITASVIGTPFAISWREKSTNNMELRTIIPASAIKPIIDVAVNSAPIIQCPGAIPIMVNGMGAITIKGIKKLRNSQTTSI